MVDDGISIGELSRQVSDVLVRFNGLAQRLESGQFVSAGVYKLQIEMIQVALKQLEDTRPTRVEYDALTQRVHDLENSTASKTEISSLTRSVADLQDDKTWLIRLVGSFIILGILAAVFVISGGGS